MSLWDKLPDEPARWYTRFELYRSLGPNRTIAQTYQITAQAEGLRKQRPGSDWYTNAKAWQWKERAEAWDKAQRERLRALEEDRRFDARETRLTMIDQLLSAVFNVLAMANLGDIDEQTARTWLPTMRILFKDLIRAQRQELGLPAGTENQRDGLAADGVAPFTADELAAAQAALRHWPQPQETSAEPDPHAQNRSRRQSMADAAPRPGEINTSINTGGGAYIEGNVAVNGGSFAGRDKQTSRAPRARIKAGPNHTRQTDHQLLLSTFLAGLYPDKQKARRLAQDAHLDLTGITLSHLSVQNWRALVAAAIQQQRLHALLSVARSEHSHNHDLIQALNYITQKVSHS